MATTTSEPLPETNAGQTRSGNNHPSAATPARMTGGEILLHTLSDLNVDTVFGYPGGVVLGLYDSIFKSEKAMKHVLVRHEQGGTHAADGYARATGKTGVVLVTSGPGATNTVTGIATAYMDSIPLVVFSGQVPSAMIGNDAFQEADIIGITRPITKHSYLVTDPNQLEDIIHEAFHIASTGRPGPVLVDLPKDVLMGTGTYTGTGKVEIRGYKPATQGNHPKIAKAAELISSAKRPLIYAGGGVILGDAAEELTALARKSSIPVTTTLMGLGGFPESDPLALGMLGMHGTWYANMAISECDLLIAIGARFDDRVTGRLESFSPHSKKIQIDIDPSSISKNVPIDVPIVGDVKQVLPVLTGMIQEAHIDDWKAAIQTWREEHPLRFKQNDATIMPQFVIQKISQVTNGEAIIVTDVGQHQMWAAQYYQFNKPRSFLTSGGLGTMGYGFPAAMGAAFGCPDRTVVCVAGDGGFQMTAFELATAVEHKVPVKIVVLNNGYLGMVRQWQEMFYGGRYSHSDLRDGNPDFVKLAESYGAAGMRTSKPDEVEKLLRESLKITDRPVLIEFLVAEEENVFPMVPAGAALQEMVEGDAS